MIVVGFLAGLLSTLSPCVLPLLPILLGGALQRHRLAPLALTGGLVLSFTLFGVAAATLGFAVGIDGDRIRDVSAALMVGAGVLLLSARLQSGFIRLASHFTGGANGLLERLPGDGLGGQFLLGLLLGAVWTPCTGPTLGAAIGMAANSGTAPAAAAGIMAVFSIGAATPMLMLAYGSRQAMTARRDGLGRLARLGKPIMGIAFLTIGLLALSGLDRRIETRLTAAMPPWLLDLTTRF